MRAASLRSSKTFDWGRRTSKIKPSKVKRLMTRHRKFSLSSAFFRDMTRA